MAEVFAEHRRLERAGVARAELPATTPAALEHPHVTSFLLLLGSATAERDVPQIRRVVKMAERGDLKVPGFEPEPRNDVQLETHGEIRLWVERFICAENAAGRGPTMQDIEHNVPATIARVRAVVNKMLAAGALEDRGTQRHVRSWWLTPLPKGKPGVKRLSAAPPAAPKSPPPKVAPKHALPLPPPILDEAALLELLVGALAGPKGLHLGARVAREIAGRLRAQLGARFKTEPLEKLVEAAVEERRRAAPMSR